jgi:predicted aspartyl protease
MTETTQGARLTRAILSSAQGRALLPLLLLLILLVQPAAPARADLPVLAAHSRSVDVRDGDVLLKGVWVVDPAIGLDLYEAGRATQAKQVTFISDVDSLTFAVQPGCTYDFIIVLDGTDSCRTRISTMRQGYRQAEPHRAAAPDTIPFTVKRDGRIHLQARINDSRPLDLMFDTGATTSLLRPSALAKGARIARDGRTLNTAFGGTAVQPTSSGNRLEIAGLIWDHESFLVADEQANDRFDGILGYDVFAGKVVAIDYGRGTMILHESLPAMAASFARFPLRFAGGLFSVAASFDTGRKTDQGWFIVDTGAVAALHLTQDFAAAQGLPGTMKRIGVSKSRGAGGGTVRNDVVLLPELSFGEFRLHDVPTHLEDPAAERSLASGCLLGMEVLRRFNAILDYQRHDLYLEPNAHFAAAFRTRFSGLALPIGIAIAVAALALLAGLVVLSARRRRRRPGAPAVSGGRWR